MAEVRGDTEHETRRPTGRLGHRKDTRLEGSDGENLRRTRLDILEYLREVKVRRVRRNHEFKTS